MPIRNPGSEMNPESYIDGFLLAVPKDQLEAYRAVSSKCGEVWKEHGALDYIETVLDDADCKGMRPFPTAANANEDEVVVFSWIHYPSKAVRDEVNAKVMTDPRIAEFSHSTSEIFDCNRMAYGGFKPIVVF